MAEKPKAQKPKAVNATVKFGGKGTLGARVRKIRHSPAADPELVKSFYAIARELRKKRLAAKAHKGARAQIPAVNSEG